MADRKTKSNKRADRVWDRLIQSYGTRVAEAYGADVPKPWCDAVDDLTDEQITYGLKAIVGVTPAHPPTLGQFVQCCSNMPVAQNKAVATLQEQLCEYASLKLLDRLKSIEFSRPWTYAYRETWDATRPKGMEKCAECTGVVIDLDNGSRLGFSVAAMQADEEPYRTVMRSFRRPPNARQQAQLDAFHEQLPDLTT
jgi:hypothetical protein